MARIYLDWAASAPPSPDIVETAARIAEETYGNPSSIHAEGRSAEALLTDSRKRLGAALGVPAKTVVFTSGGTESNNLALSSLLAQQRAAEIVVSGIEHSSVYEPAVQLERLGVHVSWVAADSSGLIDPQKIGAALSSETAMVAVMHVNNETGAVQPIGEIAKTIRSYERHSGRRIHFHCDAVQALGKISAEYGQLDVDSASFSAHKLGGPRGVGALYLRKELPVLFRGGGQEEGRRPGTENLPGIWSFAEAASRARNALDEHYRHALALRHLLIDGIGNIAGACIVPPAAAASTLAFSPYILSVAFPPLPGEALVRVLDDAGCAISTGSACSSKRAKERRVLANIGTDNDTARSAIRISTGYWTTAEEIHRFLAVLDREVRAWSTPLRA